MTAADYQQEKLEEKNVNVVLEPPVQCKIRFDTNIETVKTDDLQTELIDERRALSTFDQASFYQDLKHFKFFTSIISQVCKDGGMDGYGGDGNPESLCFQSLHFC